MNTSIDARILKELKKAAEAGTNVVLQFKCPASVYMKAHPTELLGIFESVAENKQSKDGVTGMAGELLAKIKATRTDDTQPHTGFALHHAMAIVGFPRDSFHDEVRALLAKSLGINTEADSDQNSQ